MINNGVHSVSQNFNVEHFANLARLSLKAEDVPKLQKQMNDILEMVDSLSELDLDGVADTVHAIPLNNVSRDQEPKQSLPVETVVNTFPETTENCCKVPVMIED